MNTYSKDNTGVYSKIALEKERKRSTRSEDTAKKSEIDP